MYMNQKPKHLKLKDLIYWNKAITKDLSANVAPFAPWDFAWVVRALRLAAQAAGHRPDYYLFRTRNKPGAKEITYE